MRNLPKKGPEPPFHNRPPSEGKGVESISTRKGVNDSSKGSGATPAGVARATPRKIGQRKEPLLERKRSSRDSGAIVEGVDKGYPNQRT